MSGEKEIVFYCPSGFTNDLPGNSLVARCDHDDTVILKNGQNTSIRFSDVKCMLPVKAKPKLTKLPCANGKGEIIEFGFPIDPTIWLPSVKVCFDSNEKRTFWVEHELKESSNHFQHEVERPEYGGEEFFSGLKLRTIYNRFGQYAAIERQLGKNAADKMINLKNDGMCLQRGHLSAVSEYAYGQQQQTMSNYVMVMLQWSVINNKGGNYYALEKSVKQFVKAMHITTEAYSGTHGTMEKMGKDRKMTKLYGSMHTKQMPIPAFYYKVLLDHENKKAIAAICVNDPYATFEEIQTKYNLCPDVSDQIGWEFWNGKRKVATLGYSYACKLSDFVKSVTDLPIEGDALNYELMQFKSNRPQGIQRTQSNSSNEYRGRSSGRQSEPRRSDSESPASRRSSSPPGGNRRSSSAPAPERRPSFAQAAEPRSFSVPPTERAPSFAQAAQKPYQPQPTQETPSFADATRGRKRFVQTPQKRSQSAPSQRG